MGMEGKISIGIDSSQAAQGLDAIKTELTKVSTATESTQKVISRFNDALRESGGSAYVQVANMSKLSKQLGVVSTNTSTAKLQLAELVNATTLLNNSTLKVRSSLKEMTKAIREQAAASTAATAAMMELATKAPKVDRALKNTIISASTLQQIFLGFGSALTLKWAISSLTQFDHSMAAVEAISRTTGSTLADLRDKAKELGATTIFTTSQAAEGMKYLAQSGFKANEILAASSSVLALAQAGNLGLAETSEIAAKTLRGFRIEASQMGDVADVMAATVSSSTTTIRELGDAFKYVASVSSALKVSIRETSAIIGVLSDSGIDATMAGTALRRIMSDLSNPTAKTARILASVGLSLDDVNIRTKGIIPVLTTLKEKGLDVGQAFSLFGLRGAPAFLALSANIDKVTEKYAALQDVTGRAKEMQKTMDQSLYASFNRLRSAVEFLNIQLTETSGTMTAIKVVFDGLAFAIRTVASDVKILTPVLSAIGVLVASKLYGPLIKFFGLKAFFKSMGKEVTGLSKAFAKASGIMGTFTAVGGGVVGVLGRIIGSISPIGKLMALFAAGGYILEVYEEKFNAVERAVLKYSDAINLAASGKLTAKTLADQAKEYLSSIDPAKYKETLDTLLKEQKLFAEDSARIWKDLGKSADYVYDFDALEEQFLGLKEKVKEIVGRVKEAKAAFEQTGDYSAYYKALSLAANEANGNLKKQIEILRDEVPAWQTLAAKIQAVKDAFSGLKKEVKETDTAPEKPLFAEVIPQEQEAKLKEFLEDLQYKTYSLRLESDNFAQTMDIVRRVSSDAYHSLELGLDGVIRQTQESLDKHILLKGGIADLVNQIYKLVTLQNTLKKQEDDRKEAVKWTDELNKRLGKLNELTVEQKQAKMWEEYEKMKRILGESNPLLKQYVAQLRLATSLGLGGFEELSSAKKKVQEALKKALKKGELEERIQQETQYWDEVIRYAEKFGDDYATLISAKERAINDIKRSYKDKDLQTELRFWQELISYGMLYGDEYARVVQRSIDQQMELYASVIDDQEALAQRRWMMEVEYSDKAMDGFRRGWRKTATEWANSAKIMEDITKTAMDTIADTLTALVMKSDMDFKEIYKSFLTMVNKMIIQWTIAKVILGIASLAAGPSINADGNIMNGMDYGAGSTHWAKGGAFSRGNVVPLASGGVISTPTLFPLRGGKRGLMGEAGPEAVMPLRRASDGSLGVMAAGGGGGSMIVNVYNEMGGQAQVTTNQGTDVNGFPMLDIFVSQVESRIAGNIAAGKGPVGNAIDKSRGTSRARSLYM